MSYPEFNDEHIDHFFSLTRQQVEGLSLGDRDAFVRLWKLGQNDRAKALKVLEGFVYSMKIHLHLKIEDSMKQR